MNVVSVSLPKNPEEKEGTICGSDGNPSGDNDSAGTSHLNFLTSKTVKEISVICELPNQQHLLIPLKNITGSSCVVSSHLLAYYRSRVIFSQNCCFKLCQMWQNTTGIMR